MAGASHLPMERSFTSASWSATTRRSAPRANQKSIGCASTYREVVVIHTKPHERDLQNLIGMGVSIKAEASPYIPGRSLMWITDTSEDVRDRRSSDAFAGGLPNSTAPLDPLMFYPRFLIKPECRVPSRDCERLLPCAPRAHRSVALTHLWRLTP